MTPQPSQAYTSFSFWALAAASLSGCGSSDGESDDVSATIDALSSRVAALEQAASAATPAGTDVLNTVQADVSSLDARVAAVEAQSMEHGATISDHETRIAATEALVTDLNTSVAGLVDVPTLLADLTARTNEIEASSANDFWTIDGSCNCDATSPDWTDVTGAIAFASTGRGGPLLVVGSLEAASGYCAASVRVQVLSAGGGFGYTSAEFSLSNSGLDLSDVTTVTGFADLPGAGDFVVSLQYMNGDDLPCVLGAFSLAVVQLIESPT